MNNKVDVLLGLQWGDEGKGKIVDVLTPNYDIVARFQGGPNAGHTLEFDGKHVVLRSIPSGIFQCKGVNIIGNGVVFDPILFKKEFEELSEYISKEELAKKLVISNRCFVITPLHKMQDALNEARKGKNKVGTTGKGIGPTYTDKISRIGIPLEYALSTDALTETNTKAILSNLITTSLVVGVAEAPEAYKEYVEMFCSEDPIQVSKATSMLMDEYIKALAWLNHESGIKIINTTIFINNELNTSKSVLAEGAQGTMLDIDFGTYPFVTSSNTTTGGVCTGLGVAPNKIGDVYGIFKAYCTRVGAGPFPTEDFGEDGKKIREIGHEFGAVTGRERRCGWLDLVQLKYACMINGVTKLIMMKSDVLSDFEYIKVCEKYQLEDYTYTSDMQTDLSKVTPVYKELPGWKNYKLNLATDFDSLPITFKEYVKYIENFVGVPITILSVGPDRNETIIR